MVRDDDLTRPIAPLPFFFLPPLPPNSSTTPPNNQHAETARATIIDFYEDRPSTAETMKVHTVGAGGDGNSETTERGDEQNPFANAFVNVPTVNENTFTRRPPTHPSGEADVTQTARTDVSEITDAVMNTNRCVRARAKRARKRGECHWISYRIDRLKLTLVSVEGLASLISSALRSTITRSSSQRASRTLPPPPSRPSRAAGSGAV